MRFPFGAVIRRFNGTFVSPHEEACRWKEGSSGSVGFGSQRRKRQREGELSELVAEMARAEEAARRPMDWSPNGIWTH